MGVNHRENWAARKRGCALYTRIQFYGVNTSLWSVSAAMVRTFLPQDAPHKWTDTQLCSALQVGETYTYVLEEGELFRRDPPARRSEATTQRRMRQQMIQLKSLPGNFLRVSHALVLQAFQWCAFVSSF